jgi:hypothetical protein
MCARKLMIMRCDWTKYSIVCIGGFHGVSRLWRAFYLLQALLERSVKSNDLDDEDM